MNVVYSASRNLYPYMLPSIQSLLDHNKVENIFLLIEDDALPYPVPEECTCINVSGQTIFPADGVNYRSQFTYMALMRSAYTLVLPPEIDKVIQLDIDTVVVDSLQPLWDMDISGKWFASCPEYRSTYNPFGKEEYYNIGICVYNLAQMREDNAQAQLVDVLNSRQLFCLEQDAINLLAVPDKCAKIPVRFNNSFCCGYTSNPAVIHYAGFPDWYHNRCMPKRSYLDKYIDGN